MASSDDTLSVQFPVRVESELSERLQTVVKDSKQSRNSVVRAALRFSLPTFSEQPEMVRQLDAGMSPAALKPAVSGEAINLDGELSFDVGMVAKWQNWNRQKVLLEAIRIGLPTVFARWERAYPNKAKEIPESDKERVFYYDRDANPNAEEYRNQMAKLDSMESLLDQLRAFEEGQIAYAKVQKVRDFFLAHPEMSPGDPSNLTGKEVLKLYGEIQERADYKLNAVASSVEKPSVEKKSRKKK